MIHDRTPETHSRSDVAAYAEITELLKAQKPDEALLLLDRVTNSELHDRAVVDVAVGSLWKGEDREYVDDTIMVLAYQSQTAAEAAERLEVAEHGYKQLFASW